MIRNFIEVRFTATHSLDLCERIHEHEWTVQLWASGDRTGTGWIIPFEAIRDTWLTECAARLSGAHLNEVMDKPPTCECLAEWIAKRMHGAIIEAGAKLNAVVITETMEDGATVAGAEWTPWCEEWTAEAIGPGAQ